MHYPILNQWKLPLQILEPDPSPLHITRPPTYRFWENLTIRIWIMTQHLEI